MLALGYKAEVVNNFFLQFADIASDLTIDLGAGTVERRRRHVEQTGENYQIHDLAEIVRETVLGCRVKYPQDGSRDTRCYRIDFSKINRVLPPFKPR